MGQYYHPSILKKNWRTAKNAVKVSLNSHNFGNGLKLMEHSYVGNNFVAAVMHLLANDYFGYNFVWSGDYADNVTTHTGSHSIYEDADNAIYGKDEKEKKEYLDLLDSLNVELPTYKYIVNFTKKEYVKVPKKKKNDWVVHPLPLLTADGNGRGGGDYRIDDSRVGIWKFDKIGVTNSISKFKGFKEIDGRFKLDW